MMEDNTITAQCKLQRIGELHRSGKITLPEAREEIRQHAHGLIWDVAQDDEGRARWLPPGPGSRSIRAALQKAPGQTICLGGWAGESHAWPEEHEPPQGPGGTRAELATRLEPGLSGRLTMLSEEGEGRLSAITQQALGALFAAEQEHLAQVAASKTQQAYTAAEEGMEDRFPISLEELTDTVRRIERYKQEARQLDEALHGAASWTKLHEPQIDVTQAIISLTLWSLAIACGTAACLIGSGPFARMAGALTLLVSLFHPVGALTMLRAVLAHAGSRGRQALRQEQDATPTTALEAHENIRLRVLNESIERDRSQLEALLPELEEERAGAARSLIERSHAPAHQGASAQRRADELMRSLESTLQARDGHSNNLQEA